jgi:phosphoserine phosphatase RsbU/P
VDELQIIDDRTIMESMDSGICVTDRELRIVYWNEAAERITQWQSKDIVGYGCFHGVLCHTDKEGRSLCGSESCPLQRAIVGGTSGEWPLLFVHTRDNRRVPVEVNVAPLRKGKSQIVGAVQVFRDISRAYQDLANAREIQSLALQHDLPWDARVGFTTCYIPHDVVGGDYYAIEQLSADQYGFLLADVMGHGLAAALHTMYLRGLWDRYHALLDTPAIFAARVNHELNQLFRPGESYAAGICGMVDLDRGEIVFTGFGNPPALWVHANGKFELLTCSGVPLGVMDDAPYEETRLHIQGGDRLLLFSDGVVEIATTNNRELGVKGLIEILKRHGYPQCDIKAAAIEEELLRYSQSAVLEDDQTLIEIRFPANGEEEAG